MILEIAQLGQPVLREVAAEVTAEEFKSPAFQQFIDGMLATLEDARGAGLAAPQVFQSKRVFLAGMPTPAGSEKESAVEVFVNPKIVAASEEAEASWEGCLSFIELLVLVPRALAVRVAYQTRHGEPRTLEAHDFAARVIQHENDHLDGILTIDRAETTRDIIKASELEAAEGEEQDVEQSEPQ